MRNLGSRVIALALNGSETLLVALTDALQLVAFSFKESNVAGFSNVGGGAGGSAAAAAAAAGGIPGARSGSTAGKSGGGKVERMASKYPPFKFLISLFAF